MKKLPKKFGKMKQDMIFKLQTKDWNNLSRKEQDKALLFMFRVLAELSENRKHGYSPEFWAQYP
jgi:hypothetical protein